MSMRPQIDSHFITHCSRRHLHYILANFDFLSAVFTGLLCGCNCVFLQCKTKPYKRLQMKPVLRMVSNQLRVLVIVYAQAGTAWGVEGCRVL